MTVEWPNRRLDILKALDVLAANPPILDHGQDTRWPGLDEAVHWLVDDTWWDHQDPAESIGLLLRSEADANALRRVVGAIVDISERHGPSARDGEWFGDAAWPEVQSAAREAAAALRAG